jgi:hypothetical protein
MIARVRGEHDTRWGRWRPAADRDVGAAPGHEVPRPEREPAALPWRCAWVAALLAAGAAIGVGCILVAGWGAPGRAPAELPATPRAWLDTYEAAAIDNPSRVCSKLFAPQLAQAYGKALHSSCRSYFERITSFSVVVRRVVTDGAMAVLELHQTVRPRDWAVVLSRRPGGWQAVDLLPGKPSALMGGATRSIRWRLGTGYRDLRDSHRPPDETCVCARAGTPGRRHQRCSYCPVPAALGASLKAREMARSHPRAAARPARISWLHSARRSRLPRLRQMAA